MSTLTTDLSGKGARNVKVVDLILGRVQPIQFSSLSAEEIYEVVVGAVQIARPYFKYFNIFTDFLELARYKIIYEEAITDLQKFTGDQAYRFKCLELFPMKETCLGKMPNCGNLSQISYQTEHLLLLTHKGEFMKWTYQLEEGQILTSGRIYHRILSFSIKPAFKEELVKVLYEKWNWFFKAFVKRLSSSNDDKRHRLMELDRTVSRIVSTWHMIEREKK